jgi:hypothetical protein
MSIYFKVFLFSFIFFLSLSSLAILQKACDAKYPETPTIGKAITGAARNLVASLLSPRDAGADSPSGGGLGGLFGFGRSSSSKSTPIKGAIDAPVQLPVWDANTAVVSAAHEISTLSGHVGDVEAILRSAREAAEERANLAASVAEAAAATNIHSPGSARKTVQPEDDGLDADDDDEDDDDNRGSPLGALGGADDDDDDEEEEEDDDEVVPQVKSATKVVAPVTGEDDDDDEEEEDDDDDDE